MSHTFLNMDQYLKYHYQNTLFSLGGDICYLGGDRYLSSKQLLDLYQRGHLPFDIALKRLEKFERRFRMLCGRDDGNDFQAALCQCYTLN